LTSANWNGKTMKTASRTQTNETHTEISGGRRRV